MVVHALASSPASTGTTGASSGRCGCSHAGRESGRLRFLCDTADARALPWAGLMPPSFPDPLASSRENICSVDADGQCASSHESCKQDQRGLQLQGFDELVPKYRATPLSGPGVNNRDAATGSLLLRKGNPVAAHAWAATVSRGEAFITREAPDGWASPVQSAGLVMYTNTAMQTSSSARWCSQRPTLRPSAGCPTLSRSAFRMGTVSQAACMLQPSSGIIGCTRLAMLVGCG